ncbi:Prephenate dehydratase-domain-containing protein, partial [Protomyces lactucae-debilis]
VAYLGPKGTFTYQAARQHFEQLGPAEAYIYDPVENLSDIVAAVHEGRADYGVIPFENSTNGHVVPTLDLFRAIDPQGARVTAEIYLNVHQCLLALGKMTDIQRIYSHPQAFGQCERYLAETLPNAKRINVSSTGEAAQLAAKDFGSAAVASLASAEAVGLSLLAKDIEDNANNTTRFFVLQSATGINQKATGPEKTLARLVVPHAEPGSLARILQKFAIFGFNLTSICSRPLPITDNQKWRYVFFIEFEG